MSSPRPARTPNHLAALASVALTGLDPVKVRHLASADPEVDLAEVIDSRDLTWVISAPRSTHAAARLDGESRLLNAVQGGVTFRVPRIEGTITLPEGGTAYVHRMIPGSPLRAANLQNSTTLAATLGRAIATIHGLPTTVIADADLPVYEAEEYRQRRLAEVDRAAATGQVPSALLSRWEGAIEEVTAWRFTPCVVHGDLSEETMRREAHELSGILGWSRAHVADPAEDFAWIAGATSAATFETILSAYSAKLRGEPDADLRRRAHLAGELSLARWLLLGLARDDADLVDESLAMLHALNDSTAGSLAW